ncbi:FAD/NAD(P)-binding protein [Legionella massiliensis]
MGAGPAGISLCLQLCNAFEELNIPIELILFEQNSNIGPGLPYSDQEKTFCLNLPHEHMKLLKEEPRHFSQWLHDRQESSDFPPRYYFGHYIQERFATAENNAKKVTITSLREHQVKAILPRARHQYQILAWYQSQEVSYKAHFVVLASGHLPATLFADYQALTNFQPNPWNLNAYNNLSSHSHVAIIGSHLSAIDVALKLSSQNHQGRISMVSRNGLLSAVRSQQHKHQMQFLTSDNIRRILNQKDPRELLPELIHLFSKEMGPYLPNPSLSETLTKLKKIAPLKRLNWEIRNAETNRLNWQLVLSSFYQLLYRLWPKIPFACQSEFLEKHASLMFSFLCAFPLKSAYILQAMMQRQQLSVHKGFIGIEPCSGQFLIHLKQQRPLICDYLICATGSGTQAAAQPLLAEMLKRKIIKEHPLGGICINPTNHQILTDKQEHPGFYALGDLVKGARFRIIELGQIVEQAALISQHILKSFSPATS